MGNAPSYSKIGLLQFYLEGTRNFGRAGFQKAASERFRPDDLPPNCLAGKHILVTGGNQGIGFEAALRCGELGAESIYLLCRSQQRGAEAAGLISTQYPNCRVSCEVLDVSEFGAVRKFAADFLSRSERVDVLVNNAGAMPAERTLTNEGREAIAATTYGGCMLLSGLLIPAMVKGSRIINVSSGGAYTVACHPDDLDFKEQKYDGTLFYAFAKRHQLVITKLMAEKLRGRGIAVNAMHPGWADTTAVRVSMPDFHKKQQETLRSAAEGADTIVYLAASPKVDGESGGFWFDRQRVEPDLKWAGTASTPEVEEAVWTAVFRYVGGELPSLE